MMEGTILKGETLEDGSNKRTFSIITDDEKLFASLSAVAIYIEELKRQLDQ
jgi:hypothetical protein